VKEKGDVKEKGSEENGYRNLTKEGENERGKKKQSEVMGN